MNVNVSMGSLSFFGVVVTAIVSIVIAWIRANRRPRSILLIYRGLLFAYFG